MHHAGYRIQMSPPLNQPQKDFEWSCLNVSGTKSTKVIFAFITANKHDVWTSKNTLGLFSQCIHLFNLPVVLVKN